MLQTQLNYKEGAKSMTQETQIKQKYSPYPDIAQNESSVYPYAIEKVGMRQVEIPILIEDENGSYVRQPALIDVYVDLKEPFAKGIHMSRLFNILVSYFESTPLSLVNIRKLLEALSQSQQSISSKSYLKLSYQHILKKKALLSQSKGWRYYPISYDFSYENKTLKTELQFEVTYSSTCPCSAALSRQLIQQKFDHHFSSQGTLSQKEVSQWLEKKENSGGAPHSQRSTGKVKLCFSQDNMPGVSNLINDIEESLKTPVQASVKRVDEQEFAKLNAENLMFCEDAVRILKHHFESKDFILDYKIEVEHFESLHPHNAVAIAVKGIPNGYK